MSKKNNEKRVAIYLRVGTSKQLNKDSVKEIKARLTKEGGK